MDEPFKILTLPVFKKVLQLNCKTQLIECDALNNQHVI